MITESRKGRKTTRFGVAWEQTYGYPQAVQVGDTVHVSGQLAHDIEGNLIAPAQLDANGAPVNFSAMEEQMRATYANASRVLAEFGATLDDVVQETLFVIDMPSAFAAATKVRKEVYGEDLPPIASDIIGVKSLALPEQLIEISFKASQVNKH
jgi:enamine deaminase RidA (YjgF/YER057c/UK114 family)